MQNRNHTDINSNHDRKQRRGTDRALPAAHAVNPRKQKLPRSHQQKNTAKYQQRLSAFGTDCIGKIFHRAPPCTVSAPQQTDHTNCRQCLVQAVFYRFHTPPRILQGRFFFQFILSITPLVYFCFLIIAPNESGNHVFLRDFFLTFLNFCKRETAMVKTPWLFIVPAQIHFQYYTLSLRYSCGVMPVTRLNILQKCRLSRYPACLPISFTFSSV